MKFIPIFIFSVTLMTFSSLVNATIIYNIEVQGSIVGEPYTTGSFIGNEGDSFAFYSNFHLDIDSAISSRVNWQGNKVWEINDPSLSTGSVGCINDGRSPMCVGTRSVEIEFQDGMSEKWASNPDFGHLGLTQDDVRYDIIGIGMPMVFGTNSLEYYMFLVFDDSLFEYDGVDESGLPKTIDMSNLLFAAAEFYQDEKSADIEGVARSEGFARLSISSIALEQIAEIPEPSTLAVFALGLLGLASRRFKKQA